MTIFTCYSFEAGPPKPAPTGGACCFSSEMTVELLRDEGVISIDELRIGDHVKNGMGSFDRVY
jgi:hypothetical protein